MLASSGQICLTESNDSSLEDEASKQQTETAERLILLVEDLMQR